MHYIQTVFLILSLLLTFSFFLYGFNHYYFLSQVRRYRPPSPPTEFPPRKPRVAVHLPVYNERYVVRRLVSAVASMVERYGIDDAEIAILDDSNDDTVHLVDAIAREYTRKGFQITVQRRPDRRGYKAGALQQALEATNAEYITIFDADYVPPDDFLLRTIPNFLQDDHLAIIQSRWAHLNRDFNQVTKAVSIGIDVHFFVEQTARFASGCFQNFNGSGGVLRKSALVEAGGWQSDTLAEDLDASYRVQLKGYHVLYLKDLACPGEVPPIVPGFKKQQARWANGSLRTARKLLPAILRNKNIKLHKRLEAYIHLTGYMLHPMMFASFLLASLGTIFDVDTFFIHNSLFMPLGLASGSLDQSMARNLYTLCWALLDAMILLSMVAAWISPVVSLRLQRIPVRKNSKSLLVLFLLGCGISASNTIEALKALFSNHEWEFKRTPKYARIDSPEDLRERKYQVPLDPVLLLELASACVGLVAIVSSILKGHWLVLFILIPYTAAYIFICVLTYLQSQSQPAVKYVDRGLVEPD